MRKGVCCVCNVYAHESGVCMRVCEQAYGTCVCCVSRCQCGACMWRVYTDMSRDNGASPRAPSTQSRTMQGRSAGASAEGSVPAPRSFPAPLPTSQTVPRPTPSTAAPRAPLGLGPPGGAAGTEWRVLRRRVTGPREKLFPKVGAQVVWREWMSGTSCGVVEM